MKKTKNIFRLCLFLCLMTIPFNSAFAYWYEGACTEVIDTYTSITYIWMNDETADAWIRSTNGILWEEFYTIDLKDVPCRKK